MDKLNKASVVNVELYDCSDSLISSREHIQDYVIQLCKMLDLNRVTDIHIYDDGGKGYVFHQTAENAYISGYFMLSTNCANITIFTIKHIVDVKPLGIFSYDFFMAKNMDLNFIPQKMI